MLKIVNACALCYWCSVYKDNLSVWLCMNPEVMKQENGKNVTTLDDGCDSWSPASPERWPSNKFGRDSERAQKAKREFLLWSGMESLPCHR